ncbi:hypothetical protein ALP75_200809 [Pseudomonas syringae pv. actinidiae]|nr:hypothetical protein ALP75_200809 [Pseudomonas syringae pv. actinidiae]
MLEQLIAGRAVTREDRDANAGGHNHAPSCQRDGFLHFVHDPMRQMPRLFVIGNAQQNAELITAEACNHVLNTRGAADALGDHLEQLVPGIVPQAVVDAFEVIDVQKHHCQHAFAVGVLQQLFSEYLIEAAAVDQVGQRVVMRHLLERDACLIELT